MILGGYKNKINNMLSSLAKLDDMQYEPQNKELNDIHKRLLEGRKEFEQVATNTLDSVIQMSVIDATVKMNIDKIATINESLSNEVVDISESAASTSAIASEMSKAHENLTSTIIEVSEEATQVMVEIDNCEQKLNDINEISGSAIKASREVKAEIDNLQEVVAHMNEVIDGINAISELDATDSLISSTSFDNDPLIVAILSIFTLTVASITLICITESSVLVATFSNSFLPSTSLL